MDNSIEFEHKSSLVLEKEMRKPSQKEINDIRDMAVLLEDIDIQLSYQLMSLALENRPTGPFIAKKVEAYSRVLGLESGSTALFLDKRFVRAPSQAEVNKIRDTAVLLEDIDINLASALMNLVLRYA